jgi:hypothetical protein
MRMVTVGRRYFDVVTSIVLSLRKLRDNFNWSSEPR